MTTSANKRSKAIVTPKEREKQVKKLRGATKTDSPAVPRRSSARLAKKLEDADKETPKSQGQEEALPSSLAFHTSQFNDVVGDNILSEMFKNVSPMRMISLPSSSRLMPAKRGSTNFPPEPSAANLESPNHAKALTEHDFIDDQGDASTTVPTDRPRESLRDLGRTESLNLTEMVALCGTNDFVEEEVESDPSLVTVRGYKVKEDSAALLETILAKHGDIAAQCSLSRMEWRSRFLEAACDVFLSLKETDFIHISPEEIKQKIEIVGDIEKLNIQVGWLRQRLSDILEARQLVRQSSAMKEDKDRNAEYIEGSEKQLKEFELEMAALEEKKLALEETMSTLKEKIDITKFKLVSARDKAQDINSKHSGAKVKVRRFYKQSLVDGLL